MELGLALGLLIVLLLMLAIFLRVGGLVLMVLVGGMGLLLGVTALVRLVQWLAGVRADAPGRGLDVASASRGPRVCSNPQCGRANPVAARFCAQCGTPLPRPREERA